jgi:hypothetical protein
VSGHAERLTQVRRSSCVRDRRCQALEVGVQPDIAGLVEHGAARRRPGVAQHALTMTGRDVILRMPPGRGIVVSPGHDVGFEILPVAMAHAAQRASDATT